MNKYEYEAKEFFDKTVNLDMSDLYDQFLPLIDPNGVILDAGCGSGRDTKAFLDAGYKVDAMDGSKELCKLASEHTGITVRHDRFEDYIPEHLNTMYSGIWACASLVHTRFFNLPFVLRRLTSNLLSDGVMYMSFVNGTKETRDKDGLYFTQLTANNARMIVETPDLKCHIIRTWISEGIAGRDRRWLNCLIKKY
jgi:SAM-dependent methyltransferase